MKAKKTKFRFKVLNEKCPFCESGENPDYKDWQNIEKYITDRAKIMSSQRSGICSNHQRKLSNAIKRARHLSLLSFVEKV